MNLSKLRKGEEISIPTFHTMAPSTDYRVQTAFLSMLHAVVVKKGPRHFGTWDGTVWHLGQDSSTLRSELSLGHFGTSADLSGQFGPTKLVPKCPGFEMSRVRSPVKCGFADLRTCGFSNV